MTNIAYRYASRALANQFAKELQEASEQLQKTVDEYEDSLCNPNKHPMGFGDLVDRYEQVDCLVSCAKDRICEALEAMMKERGVQQ